MTDEPSTRLYSPDGRYWWDGGDWQPVEPAAAPQWGTAPPQWGAPTPQWGTAAPQGGAAPPREARPRKGFPAVLLVGLVAVVALLAGGVGGSVAGRALINSSGPSAPPAIPAEFPSSSQGYLQGVTVSQLTQELLGRGDTWVCEPSTGIRVLSGAKQQTACGDRDHAARVYIEYDDETQIRRVDANCYLGPRSPVCESVFTDLAGMALNGQPDLQQQARDWAAQNVDSDLSTVIGGVELAVSLEPHSIAYRPAP